MSSNLDSVHIEPSPSKEVLYATLASLWRRKLLMVTIVGSALALGIIAVLVMPERYTAEAYIRGGFEASDAVVADDNTRSAAPFQITLDLVRVIETQSRLLQSKQLARRVVEHLGLERLRPEVSEGPWLAAKFYGNVANVSDMAATRLLRGLSVQTDPRAYLIAVRYTAGDSGLAALITNAFVAECLRSTRLQTLSQQRSSAQAALSEQLATFGDKHPKVTQARMRLADADNLLKEQLSKASEEILQAGGQNVTIARANAIPSSPKSTVCDRSLSARWPAGRHRRCSLAGARQVVGNVISTCTSLLDPNLAVRFA